MRNMDEKFAIMSKGPHYHEGTGYNTQEQARDDGALVLAYGCAFPLPAIIEITGAQ
jgi:large conductance mechanosensitive channel